MSCCRKIWICVSWGKRKHRIYVKEGIAEMLNFQDIGGKAKPYQVKQLCKVIEKYSLLEENGDA